MILSRLLIPPAAGSWGMSSMRISIASTSSLVFGSLVTLLRRPLPLSCSVVMYQALWLVFTLST